MSEQGKLRIKVREGIYVYNRTNELVSTLSTPIPGVLDPATFM